MMKMQTTEVTENQLTDCLVILAGSIVHLASWVLLGRDYLPRMESQEGIVLYHC